MAHSATFLAAGFLALGVAPISVNGADRSDLPTEKGFVLEMEAANPTGGILEVFYDVGRGYNNHLDWISIDLPPSSDLESYRLELARLPIKRLRIDPAQAETVMRIGRVRLLSPDDDVLVEWEPEDLVPINQIDSVRIEDGASVITVAEGANDPMLYVRDPPLEVTARWLDRKFVGAPGIMFLAVVMVTFLAVGWRGAYMAVAPRSDRGQRRRTALAVAGVFMLVFGIRLGLIGQYGLPIPYWDEWDMDIHYLLFPLLNGHLDWVALFENQSEHRIVVTRIINLVSFLINGEFDPRIGMVAGALMWSATVALLSAAMFSALPSRWYPALAPFWVVAALPFDSVNLFWGGQSQMYALPFTAACVLGLAAVDRPRLFHFAAAAAVSTVSLFTMGSGLVAPLIAGAICGFRALRERSRNPAMIAYSAVFFLVGSGGILIYETSPWHAPDYTRSLLGFLWTYVDVSSWPLPPFPGLALVFWLPWIILTVLVLFGRLPTARSACGWLAFGLGIWALGHVIGLSYARPELSPSTGPRYFTSMFAFLPANLAAVVLLWRSGLPAPIRWMITVSVLVGVAGVGMHGLRGFQAAQNHHDRQLIHINLITEYVQTRDPAVMHYVNPVRSPFWNSDELAVRLEAENIIAVLPFGLRHPITEPLSEPDHASAAPGPLTRIAVVWLRFGPMLAGCGGILLLAASFLPGPRIPKETVVSPLME